VGPQAGYQLIRDTVIVELNHSISACTGCPSKRRPSTSTARFFCEKAWKLWQQEFQVKGYQDDEGNPNPLFTALGQEWRCGRQ
jgi:hypothetical protein